MSKSKPLFEQDMSTNYKDIIINDEVFRLVGTESTGFGLDKTIDTYRSNKTGKFHAVNRVKLYNMWKSGKVDSYGEPSVRWVTEGWGKNKRRRIQ